MIKRLLVLTVLLLLSTAPVLSQKVDTMEYEGKQYLVYPFKKEVRSHSLYKHILNISKEYSKEMNAYYKRIASGDQSVTVEELRAMGERDAWLNTYGSRPDYYSRKLRKAARKNPYPLLNQRFSLDEDIIPSLDPIPDGEYLQLYEDVCLTDEKGRCQETKVFIAGKFSIKNNALHGEAMWFNLQGDTLKHGVFNNGLREGEWKLVTYELGYSFDKKDANDYIENGAPEMDTTIVYYTYKNGAKDGPFREYYMADYPIVEGHYAQGKPSGEWIERDVEIKYEYSGYFRKIRVRNNETITDRWTYASEEDTAVVRHPWIRTKLVSYTGGSDEYNFYQYRSVPFPPSDLFRIAFDEEEQLEMEEETWDSYDLYGGGDDYYQEYGIYDGVYGRNSSGYVTDPITDLVYKRGYAIDSVGMIANYSGIMEATYLNGQTAYRYEFKDGHLVSEDTIFWDNGNAYDVIEYKADSNHYVRSIYDYDGKLFRKTVYDSLGDFSHYQFYFNDEEYVYIDGYKIQVSDYQDYYRYDNWDTLGVDTLEEKIVLTKTWYKNDTSLVFLCTFDPTTRTLIEESYGADGTLAEHKEFIFSEDYESWTGTRDRFYGPYASKIVRSGTLKEYTYTDTIPARNMRYYISRYDVSSDFTLYKDGVPYTGDVNISFDNKTKLFNKGIDWEINTNENYRKRNRIERKRFKQIEKNRSKGKEIKLPELSYLNAGETEDYFGISFYEAFVPNNLRSVLKQENDSYLYTRSSGLSGAISGYMLDGKPHGTWKLFDDSKKQELEIEVGFANGEIHGDYNEYATQYPFTFYRSEKLEALMRDSVPDESTRYLKQTGMYKNDKRDGKFITYNWLGEMTEELSYKDDYLDGRCIERNNLITTYSSYKDGLEDGYYQTYLTLPNRDSMLLYDLNFQDGLLQGKSESYHVNGKLAKRGFFLNGEPIEDYEAFDSLGFRYHYVKFEYSYPVEEKLWEENQLSVRYLFDWKDSIEFVPRDITQSESLERLVAKLGLIDDYLSRPYFGRSTLVDKDDVRYHMTKYYPNDTIARDGDLDDGKKIGHWKFYDYFGELLYEVDYKDSIFSLNDSIRFKSRGILTDISPEGDTLYKAHIIEKFEKYDCSHTDHYEIRQLYTIWEADDSLGRMNGYVYNYYDNGVIQSEGQLKDGLPTGAWKLYDPFGKLNQYGYYVQGKRDGRWLSGDLSKTKYLGDICLNPNLPDLEREIKYRENLLDITITNFRLGKALNKQYYDLDMNQFRDLDDDAALED